MAEFHCFYCFQVCFCHMILIVSLMTRGLHSVYILLRLCPFKYARALIKNSVNDYVTNVKPLQQPPVLCPDISEI